MTLVAAVTGAALLSFSAIFFGLSEVTPATGAFFRAAYALPVLLVMWMTRRKQDHRPMSRRWIAVGAGLALGADVVSWHASIGLIGAGLATLLANTQVVFVALVAWILLGERPRGTTLGAIPLILFGVVLISGVGQGDPFGTDPMGGTLLALLAAVFYAVYILGYRQSNSDKVPVAGALMEATLGAAIASLLVGLIGSGIDLTPTWPAHGWLLALALGPQVFGWLSIGYALPRLPAAETATIILLQPALTMVWGAIIFDERPSALQIIGAVIVLSGVTVVALVRSRRTAQPSTV